LLDELKNANCVVGVKQTKRAIQDDSAACVYIACDAEERLTDPIRTLCEAHTVPIVEVGTMHALGNACGIAVGAAVAARLR